MAIRKLIIALLVLYTGLQATAQGLFDFGQIPGVGEPSVQIDLDPWLLGFVGEATRPGDPATADLLAGLSGIRVRIYESMRDAAAVAGFVDDASQALESDGWQRMVYIQDGEDKVRIYVKREEANLSGMTVMVVDASDAVFLNIAGSITPEQLGRVVAAVGLDDVAGALGSMGQQPANATD
jgi:hypothetical protein